jgi:glycosyltransferase involved in cell wall biosynthesis
MNKPGARMNILIVSSEAPPITSGVSRCVDRLATGLRARGHHVDVLSSLQVPRLTLRELRLSSLSMHWRRLADGLQDYDLVNLHGPAPTVSDVFLYLMSRLPCDRRPRVVYTHHGPMAIPRLRVACTFYNTVHRVLSRRSELVVTSSRDYAEYHFMPGGPPVAVVPWGVDRPPAAPRSERPDRPEQPQHSEHPAGRTPATAPGATRHHGHDHGAARDRSASEERTSPLRVLFVGQMRPYKGVDTLLRSVAGQPSIDLTLIGRGPKLDHYRRLAARLGVDNATFRGWLPDDAVTAEYARHDVITLPSVTTAEAFGLVLLEGMRSGCVPVASDLPGVREVAGPTGALVPPGDADALRGTLLSLARDRARLDLLRPLSIRRALDLSWDVCVDRYEELFALTLAGRRPTGIGAGHATDPQRDPQVSVSGGVNGSGSVNGSGDVNGSVNGSGSAGGIPHTNGHGTGHPHPTTRNPGQVRRGSPELRLDTPLRLLTADLVIGLRGDGAVRREVTERHEIKERV